MHFSPGRIRLFRNNKCVSCGSETILSLTSKQLTYKLYIWKQEKDIKM
jgi:hypothetical protein